ncbi:MAG: AAA family ATPase [archaeon]
MSIFDNMLKSDESLFTDEVPLDYSYIPKLVPYREKEQQQIALCIKPLQARRNGKNVLIYGTPGIGKTVAVRHLLRELEETSEEIVPVYINCWQKNTSFKVAIELCDALNYKFTHNKRTEELLKIAIEILNKKSTVLCFDEIDKCEELDFLYGILEQVYRKSILLITNYKVWATDLDERLKSRLTLEAIEFRKYNEAETLGILKERLKYAFVPGCWDNDAINLAAKKSFELGDIRQGLYIVREAGNAAENRASKKITVSHVESAIKKLTEFNVKKSTDLADDEKKILDIIKENSGKKIGELYDSFKEKGGDSSYKTFQRKIEFLAKNKYITADKTEGGKSGNTTIIHYAQRKLDEF